MTRILDSADRFWDHGRFGAGNRQRIRAMVLLLRHAGLRISDATCLKRARLSGTRLFLYTQKTVTPVWVPLPKDVVEALDAAPNDHPDYVFWNRQCLRTSAVKIWERTLARLFELAKIDGGHRTDSATRS